MLTYAEHYAANRRAVRRHHYILLLSSQDDQMTKQVEMFASDISEAISLGCRSHLFQQVEIWEDGYNRGLRQLPKC